MAKLICPECNTKIEVGEWMGEKETRIWKCVCGYEESGFNWGLMYNPKLFCECGWTGSYDDLVVNYYPNPREPGDVTPEPICPACKSPGGLEEKEDDYIQRP